MMLENAVLATLEACASPLEQIAQAKGWERTTERDFQRAMESVTDSGAAPLRLEHWPAVGPVDVMLPGRAALELKWCKSGDTLGHCAWDIAKLGCALAERQVERAFIAAGAPAPHWRSSAPGVELFTPRVYEYDAIVRAYESWWRRAHPPGPEGSAGS